MSLLKKPEKTKNALKVLGFGESGSGKTTFALTFPKNIICDSETGYEFYKDNPNIELIATTNSIYDLEEILEEVEELIEDNKVGTFTIDSLTKFYNNLQVIYQELTERRARRKGQDVEDSSLSMREWAKIKNTLKRINDVQLMMASKGVNIVNICQMKEVKEKRGDNFVVVGVEPDTMRNTSYDYDIVLNFYTEEDKKSGDIKYFAKVLKDRTGTYKKNDVIENPSYSNWEKTYSKYAKAKESVIDFNKDYNKDIAKTEQEEASATEIVDSIKTFLKTATTEQKAVISKAMKNLELNIKDLASNDINKLKEVQDLINTL